MAKRMAVKTTKKKQRQLPQLKIALPKPVLRAMVGLFGIVIIAAIIHWLSSLPSITTNIWPIEKVSFGGDTQRINKAGLIEKLGLANGKGMLSVDLQKVRSEVLENPWVESVEIRKQWPDTLIFTLYEKKPIAILNDGFLLADGQVVKTEVTAQDENELLTIRIEKTENINQQKLLAMTELLTKVNQKLASNNFLLSEIEIDKTNSWNLKTATDVLIKTGRKNHLQRLDRFLQVYVAIENKNQLNSVDLRYRNGLAVELKSNAISEES